MSDTYPADTGGAIPCFQACAPFRLPDNDIVYRRNVVLSTSVASTGLRYLGDFTGRVRSQGESSGFSFEISEDELRQVAATQGLDFDDLVDKASRHFVSDTVRPWEVPLTDAEADELGQDDDRSLHA